MAGVRVRYVRERQAIEVEGFGTVRFTGAEVYGPVAVLGPASALHLLTAGRADLLRGQPESDWLEAKGQPYRLDEESESFELAKDVAALANGPEGGIIVLGLTTRKQAGDEYVAGLNPFPVTDIS